MKAEKPIVATLDIMWHQCTKITATECNDQVAISISWSIKSQSLKRRLVLRNGRTDLFHLGVV